MTRHLGLEKLLQERFDIRVEDFVAALAALPPTRPAAVALTAAEAQMLDDAGFSADAGAYPAAVGESAGRAAQLAVTAFTAEEVATGLGISASRVRQKRLARELWAIPDGKTWLFPALQFETTARGGPSRQVRGLARVFQTLPEDLHPVSVAGFLHTAQPDLFHDRAMTPVEWLRDGGEVEQVVAAAAGIDWYTA